MNLDGNLVRYQRQGRGWTQQQLADVAALSLRTVQRVENQGIGSHETVSSLCAVLTLEREQLLAPSRRLEQQQRQQWRVLALMAAALLLGVGIGVAGTLALF
ncbi:helix-turn-helix domain-containing protein [Gilvimarinus algae]|uniref:Helix-turn-helix domain-containing protein n=1 Tax=Gilvimarinus algae TaxID=3058037 RepID=A0ABT8TI78_9GAMM|nr:helix-turn-helix domain-containing protein [Gilvimarinus sp. SDUM040014]MDO3383807.1 helix-turn-helix domain-containing protein [Gilvimarinus sp. SDUM040014]